MQVKTVVGSILIIQVGPYLVALVCIPPFIDDLFRVCAIFWFLYFDLFQVKMELRSILTCIPDSH